MPKTASGVREANKGRGRKPAAQGGQVQSLGRALSILERLAEADGMTLTDLAQSVGLAPSTTHRLLTTRRHVATLPLLRPLPGPFCAAAP